MTCIIVIKFSADVEIINLLIFWIWAFFFFLCFLMHGHWRPDTISTVLCVSTCSHSNMRCLCLRPQPLLPPVLSVSRSLWWLWCWRPWRRTENSNPFPHVPLKVVPSRMTNANTAAPNQFHQTPFPPHHFCPYLFLSLGSVSSINTGPICQRFSRLHLRQRLVSSARRDWDTMSCVKHAKLPFYL